MKKKYIKGTRQLIKGNLLYIKGKTLDLGAGRAKYKGLISSRAGQYIAFDKFNNGNIDITGDIHNTKLSDNEFDTIICTQALEHIKNPFLVVKEIKRILKRGGNCIVTAPFMYPYHPDPEDNFRYSKEGLRSMFEKENFYIIDYGCYGGIFTHIADIIKTTFVSPYKKHSRLKHKIFEYVIRVLMYFDSFITPQTIYSNSYIIAQKK